MNTVKHQLFDLCQQFVLKRIATAKEAVQIAQSAANDETKNSAGDKYETGRAMMELEAEQNNTQLREALKLKQQLDQVNPAAQSPTAQIGSIVLTSQGNFFIAISAGKLSADNTDYYAVSLDSPIGQQMKGRREGDSFIFNSRNYQIRKVC